jgi:DNA-binding MarR family transcriptional regulator
MHTEGDRRHTEGQRPWQDGLPFLLWRTQLAVHRSLQDSIADLGVTMTQLGLAVHLFELGPLSASDLSRGYRITPQSVTTNLTQLERLGWITRHPHPVHGRIVLNLLTDAGRDGVAAGRAQIADATRGFEDLLGAPATDTVVASLKRIMTAIDGEDPKIGMLWPLPETR